MEALREDFIPKTVRPFILAFIDGQLVPDTRESLEYSHEAAQRVLDEQKSRGADEIEIVRYRIALLRAYGSYLELLAVRMES